MLAVHNMAEGVLEQLLEGYDLRMFLRPDDSVKNRSGTETYIESLDLPHIIVNDDGFWACLRNLTLSVSEGPLMSGFFSYYSGMDVFSNSTYRSIEDAVQRNPQRSLIMSTGRYEQLRWIVHGHPKLVYDSDKEPTALNDYIEAITGGARFKVIIHMTDDSVQIHPVVYPFYFPNDDRLDLQTEVQFFPDFMRSSVQVLLSRYLSDQGRKFTDYRTKEAKEYAELLEPPFFSSYFRLYRGAEGHRIYDIKAKRLVKFSRIEVYAMY